MSHPLEGKLLSVRPKTMRKVRDLEIGDVVVWSRRRPRAVVAELGPMNSLVRVKMEFSVRGCDWSDNYHLRPSDELEICEPQPDDPRV